MINILVIDDNLYYSKLSLINNEYVFSYINKIDGLDKISEEVNNLINIKQDNDIDIRNKVMKELNYLNFNNTFVGTKYLLESIIIIIKHKLKNYNLKKDIYPIVASKNI